jgi:threonine synthase
LFVAPEGGACLPALRLLFDRELVDRSERVVLFNTGAGIKYLEVLDTV